VAAIADALGDASHILNVGAGSGSYEPTSLAVVAIEPSAVMIGQRATGAAPVVRAVAEALPVADGTFDAVLAVLTSHHWSDRGAGLDELCRVAPLRVVLTFDPVVNAQQWIVRDYLPEIAAFDAGRGSLEAMAEQLEASTTMLPLTRGFEDGVLGAFWCRPDAYLDPAVRRHISGLARLDPSVVDEAMGRLADDLDSGAWDRRHRSLADLEAYDAGYRLLVSGR
jgi:hypothetical protein